ncbi:MAG: sodium-dependent transporter [Eubacteriales bacterium]|nr:sodium-dependent transporter [Eubacteriales bacterium]
MSSKEKRGTFSGSLGYVLATAGSAVGLGNIWRFPYLAAKYGGGIFLLVYIILVIFFGTIMIYAETALGRMTRKSPIGAFTSFGSGFRFKLGGVLNAIAPMIIAPYYCVIGGWVMKYLFAYLTQGMKNMADDTFFSNFISNSESAEFWFIVFLLITLAIILAGVKSGIERVSMIMMPALIILAVIVAIFSITRPGALAGVKYLFLPNFREFSIKTIVAALGQMFYSLSIAMGILYTYGSYMKKDVNITKSGNQIAIVDTTVAVLASLMVIPGVFAYSGGSLKALNAGPSLMFITLPKVFQGMGGIGHITAILFFVLVFFAALTSSISLLETCTSTFQDQLHLSRPKSAALTTVLCIILGTLSAVGYGVLSNVTIIGMQFLDFFDFISNSVILPISALCTCLLITYAVGFDRFKKEIEISGPFTRESTFRVIIKYVAPVLLLVIFVTSILGAFGLYKI